MQHHKKKIDFVKFPFSNVINYLLRRNVKKYGFIYVRPQQCPFVLDHVCSIKFIFSVFKRRVGGQGALHQTSTDILDVFLGFATDCDRKKLCGLRLP